MTAPSSKAALLVFTLICTALCALAGRVAYLQTWGSQHNIGRAERQQFQTEPLYARRGSIFDRNGMLMAGTVQGNSVFVDPKFMAEQFKDQGREPGLAMDDAAAKLASLIDKPVAPLSRLLNDKAEARFVRIADNIDDSTAAAIRKLDLPGVGFTPYDQRFYPMGSIGAHVLGGVGGDGKGLEGVELRFDKLLAGRDGSKRTLKDARRRPIFVDADDYVPPRHGAQLILTIDANIQSITEDELKKACEQYKAPTGEAVVMDPYTGEVLALANYPTFNPQTINEAPAALRTDRAIVFPYEPGSTIKPFIVGPAIQNKVARLDEIFHLGGDAWPAGYGHRIIRDVHGYNQLALWDVLVKSSNIGMCQLGQRLGNNGLFNNLTGFHFGQRTGIDLPGEDPGLINPLKKWNRFSTESVSQGYEMRVTPLQLARGMCAYANGGKLVTPHVVEGTVDADGQVIKTASRISLANMPQVITPEAAAQIRRVLCDVLVRGTATKARSSVYNVFGKTGTAHSAVNGSYNEENYTSSFIGGAPYENPKLVIAMVIHNPDKHLAHFGGIVAGPAASHTLERSLQYLQVPPTGDLPLPPPSVQSVLYAYDANLYKKPKPEETASTKE